ncbi:Set1/Ash2 histone methyltransferase complex subunit ASH2 [Haematococcus lacustris]|uniref:Set1/Ash2 histone methyltransferase complex subunit ASH2 n=1 Tax=Haematococcus lacustris TaxID=44745 RepID=A0A6A0AI98_HAELA|nr:Set1/Ash2 histone methyltransferase complex subunit ASH2 [Haematococcus lacustris]
MADGNRSKAQRSTKKRGRAGPAALEELALTAGQSEHVKPVRVDVKKDVSLEDPHRVQMSKIGKAPQLQLSDDRLTVTGYKGFRTCRCSHGVHQGTWYCEAKITRLGKTGHVRLGWCTKKAELQAPVGFDTFGYCYRDLEGSKVHDGKRESYGQSYAEGDVVGLLIHLPPGGRALESIDRTVSRFKGSLYYVDEPEPKPQVPGQGLVNAMCSNATPITERGAAAAAPASTESVTVEGGTSAALKESDASAVNPAAAPAVD